MIPKNELYITSGHCVITLTNGYRLSMTNFKGSHCRNLYEDSYRTMSSDAEVMIFDCNGQDITKVFFKNASPDASNVSMDTIGKILVEIGKNNGQYKNEDLE